MCPGLIPGAKLYPAAVDMIVAIMPEGKQHVLCVGIIILRFESQQRNYLNNGLWHMKTYINEPQKECTELNIDRYCAVSVFVSVCDGMKTIPLWLC